MATQITSHSAETVALNFVNQYYGILQKLIDQAYRFYKENSVLSWSLPNGEIKCVKTSKDIKKFIISSHFKDNKVEITTIDFQSSAAGSVLVMVTACLVMQDDSRKYFSQSFFLAPQEKGYYVLNDIFRFVGLEESSMVDENSSLSPSAIERKTECVIKEVSEKSDNKMTIDDQVGQNTSITSSKKEKSVAETAPVIQNEDPKVSYASMLKQGRSSQPMNDPHNIERDVTDAGLPSKSKKTQSNSLVQALKSDSSVISKATTRPTNAAQDNYDKISYKSIYIGGLPSDTTTNDLYAIVKEFGPVHTRDVQLKTYDDGYCCGFVHFQDAVSAQNAVQAHYIIVKGREAHIRFKRLK